MNLADLPVGGRGRVSGLVGDGPVVQRILQLGVLPGGEVRLVRRAPSGDPIEIEVLGYSLSLRRDEARRIELAEEPA